MTSFLTDVLVTAGKQEKVDLNEKIEVIQKEIIKLKHAVKEFMTEKYFEFSPSLKSDQALVIKAEALSAEIKSLQKRVDDQIKIELTGSAKELKNLLITLKEYNCSLEIAGQLLEVHNCFKTLENLQIEKNGQYIKGAQTLAKLLSLLNQENSDLQQLDIYPSLKAEYLVTYSLFVDDIISLWQEQVQWKDAEKTGPENAVQLCIHGDSEEIQSLIQALQHINRLTMCMEGFSKKLLKYIISPIIDSKCSVSVVDEQMFTVKIINQKEVPGCKNVLYNLTLLFKFLHQNLNITVNNEEQFLSRLASHMLQEFSNILIQNCISGTIPSSSIELEKFEPIVKDIREFQNHLIDIGFISQEQQFLTKYTENIDNLYINKKCQNLMGTARDIMKEDLHDSIWYEPKDPTTLQDEILHDYKYELDRNLSKIGIALPPCRISKSATKIINLIKEILDEVCTSTDIFAVRLFYTCRNIFEMYSSVVPEHHKEFLATIPQQVALFHNNCMYFSTHLITLTFDYKDKLPDILKSHNATFADITLNFREIGADHFLNHMAYQRDIILDILRESGLASIGQTATLPDTTEKALRQCVRQLELLKTVWIDVLPIKVYCRAIGCIVNDMVDDLITKVVSVEDIPADVASELVELFQMVMKRIPYIFPEPEKIKEFVRKATRLSELIIVLGASLREIDERWGDGKGPLASEFNAYHVKQLIRALFQNTDRRSNLLSKIK